MARASEKSFNLTRGASQLLNSAFLAKNNNLQPPVVNVLKHFFIFNFLFHNSHDKFDRQIIVSNQINQIES